MKHKGYDDSRPNAAFPKPGKTDCTSHGARAGWGKEQNVSPYADRSKQSEGWKGQRDQRPSAK